MESRSFLHFCSKIKQVAKVAYNIIYETPHTYKPSISQQSNLPELLHPLGTSLIKLIRYIITLTIGIQ